MKKGFTLLELLIVVVIIGVLALIAAPTLLNATDQAKEGTVKANISAAASSITSRFALNTNDTATEIATAVADALNADNTNPIDDANAAFSTAGTAAGSVVLTGDNNTDTITIIGYDKNQAALLTKVVAAPADN
ncbi:MAG: prepilin-type N-terminal cleavage/methylation domain-containing protein [Candidatus Gastranaerophilales bacterium]|nr:prepilin-type N-terminal cleavage/methylation domain-containing protein [Candidatus Gastranaerophilales bacterium]